MIRHLLIRFSSYLTFCILSSVIAVPSSFAGMLFTPPIQQDGGAGENVRCLVSNTTDKQLKVDVTMYNNVGNVVAHGTRPIQPFGTYNLFAPGPFLNNNAFCQAFFKGKASDVRLTICVAPSINTNCDRYVVGY